MRVLLAFVITAGPVLATGCAREAGSEARNVVLVTIDTARADAFGCEDGGRLTPSFCSLAAEGARFTRAYTVAPLTLPSHASILTGLIPPRHGLRTNGRKALDASASTMAEAFRSAGFETAAFVSSAVLDRCFGLDQGFDVYEDLNADAAQTYDPLTARPGIETVQSARRWLATEHDPSRRFFLWVHLYDPHLPRTPSPEHSERAGGNPYLGEIAEADAALGALLELLRERGWMEDTVVAVTSDHGEGLGDHGEPSHGALCYESVMHVPLVLRLPWASAAMTSDAVVSLVDLYPTLLAACGIVARADVDGANLLSSAPARGAYFEAWTGWYQYGWSPLAGLVNGNRKYIASSRPELYDPVRDPREEVDLAEREPAACELARLELASLYARPRLRPTGASKDMTPVLSALGYAQGSGQDEDDLPCPLAPSTRVSPRDGAVELAPLTVAADWVRRGLFSEAIPYLESILERNRNHPMALELYGLTLMYVGEFAQALAVLDHRHRMGNARPDVELNRALCMERLGQLDQAREALLRAEALRPGDPEIDMARRRIEGSISPAR